MQIEKYILMVLVIALLPGCKIDVSVNGDGSVTSSTGNIADCREENAGSEACRHEYVTVLENCDGYDAFDSNKDEAHELDCTVIGSGEAVEEELVATPDEDNSFDGWAGDCSGANTCRYTITEDEAADDSKTWQVEASFEPEPLPEEASYTHNYLGQRTSKTVGTLTTYYIYNQSGQLVREHTSTGISRVYVYMYKELVSVYEENDQGSQNIYYPVKDHLGQLRQLLAIGETLSSERYATPFGQTHSQYQVASLSEHNTRLPGQYYDKESGYHENGFRSYEPGLGLYVQADRLDALSRAVDPDLKLIVHLGVVELPQAGQYNELYAYAQQNPIMRFDVSGLAMEDFEDWPGETIVDILPPENNTELYPPGSSGAYEKSWPNNVTSLHGLCFVCVVDPETGRTYCAMSFIEEHMNESSNLITGEDDINDAIDEAIDNLMEATSPQTIIENGLTREDYL